MHTVARSVTVPYSPADMYNLVADIDRYHEFLPWCTGSQIVETQGDEDEAPADEEAAAS